MAESVRGQLSNGSRTRRARLPLIGILVINFVVSGCRSASSYETSTTSGDWAVVSKVIDGDTIEIIIDEEPNRVRLLGIDAPESVHPQLPVQCFGPQASAALAELLPPGTLVELRRDVQARDHYDRLLLYVYRAADGLFVNQWLVENGLADESHYQPNSANKSELTRAKRSARANSVGLWGSCDGPDQPLR